MIVARLTIAVLLITGCGASETTSTPPAAAPSPAAAVFPTAVEPLAFAVGRGDTVQKVVERHIGEIKESITTGHLSSLTVDELTREILHHNLSEVMVTVNPGNRVAVYPDGRLEVQTGRGEPPKPNDIYTLKTKVEDLMAQLPEDSHDHLVERVKRRGVVMRSYSMNEDHTRVTIGERVYVAKAGITFVPRNEHFHVIGTINTREFNVAVWPVEGTDFDFPTNPYFMERANGEIVPKKGREAELARLLEEEQLVSHDGYYRVTRKFDFEPWQKIIRAAASPEESKIRQQLATQIQIILLKDKTHIDSGDFARDLFAIKKKIMRAWKAFEAEASGPELYFVVRYNATLDMGGKLLWLGEQLLSAGEGLQFGFCKKHIHVIDERGINVAIAPEVGERVKMPKNIFLVQQSDSISRRPLPPKVVELLDKKQIHAHDHKYTITQDFRPKIFAAMLEVIGDEKGSTQTRVELQKTIDGILSTELPIDSVEGLLKAVDQLDERLNKAYAALTKHKKKPGRRKKR